VCAVAGGIVAQEVLKIVSGKGSPLWNLFTFDGVQGAGIIETIEPKAQ